MVRMRSPVRIWLSAPKKQRPHRGLCFFRVGRYRTGDLKCEAFYNKTNSIAVRCCPPVRIRLSRRRKLHIACDDFFCFASKVVSRSFRCSSFQNQNRTGAARLVDNFGAALCRVLILWGRGIAEITPHGSEKADAKTAIRDCVLSGGVIKLFYQTIRFQNSGH